MDVCSDHAWIALNDKLSRESMMENIAFDSPEARFLCFRVFHDNLNLSTNLYASLWFRTKDAAEQRLVASIIAMLVSYYTIT